jgi:hypothetical protein
LEPRQNHPTENFGLRERDFAQAKASFDVIVLVKSNAGRFGVRRIPLLKAGEIWNAS